MGLTCLIKLVRFLYLIFAEFLYHFSCIDVCFYFLVHCTYSQLSKWRPSAILDFQNFALFVKNCKLCLFLHPCAKFGEDRTICSWVIAYFRLSKWWPSAILDLVYVISDHPQLVFDGPNILLKLHIDRVYTLQDITIFIFGPFGLKLPIHAVFVFWGDITPKWILILSQPPKGLSTGENTLYEP